MEALPLALDMQPASEEQRLAAYRNVFDVWSGGLSMEEHLARRLRSPQHNRAKWFVGCVAGRVVASLACYPLRFHLHGRSVAGMAIGSVHTLAEFRGRGFAPKLIDWVERRRRGDGAAISLLYSDISPDYYARLGYQRCPAREGYSKTDAPPPPDGLSLRRFEPAPETAAMAALYEAHHAVAPIAIERTADYWRYLLTKSQQDEFYWLVDAADRPLGYVRLAVTPSGTRVSDYAIAPDTSASLESLYALALNLAAERGWPSLGGWLPDKPAARKWFDLTPRAKEITMLKPLDPATRLDAETLGSAEGFCEVDHV